MQLPSRNLAAVLFADIVGYSRIAFQDEDRAYRLAMKFQSVVHADVARYGGKLVKFMGDGALAVFPSADSAVQAGLALIREFRLYDEHGKQCLVRVGVHLGDVLTAADGDVYGDGVNTASRLHQAAEPGQVIASEDVWRQLRHRADFRIEALGGKVLKGLPDPIDAFLIHSGPEDNDPGRFPAPSVARLNRVPIISVASVVVVLGLGLLYYRSISPDRDVRRSQARSEFPAVEADSTELSPLSIVVLPFLDLSSEGDLEFLADGITEELTSSLARIQELRVVSRTSAYEYSEGADVRTIGKDLGARMIMEGSVRIEGSTVRITVQLINAMNGYHVWSQSYDREAEKYLAMQKEVAVGVVNELNTIFLPLRSNPDLLTIN